MKQLRYWQILVFIVSLCLVLLTGCGGKVTAESLLKDVEANVESVGAFQGNMSMNIVMGAEQYGYSMDVNTYIKLDMVVTEGPEAFHYTGEMGMNMFDLTAKVEAYGVQEEDTFVTYTGMDGYWQREEGDNSDSQMRLSDFLSLEVFAGDAEWILADKTEEFNGKDVYVLTADITDEDFHNALNNSAGEMAADIFESLDVDFSGFSMDIVLKIYKDSKLPAVISMSVPEDDPVTIEQDGAALALKELSYSVEFLEYNTLDEIIVPEDVKSSVGEFGWTEEKTELRRDSRANFILTDSDNTVDFSVAPLDDYEISEYASNTYLDFYPMEEDGDFYSHIAYTVTMLDESWTVKDIEDVYQIDESFYSEEDGYHDVEISDVKTMDVNGLKVSYIIVAYGYDHSSWDTQIYAWADMGNGSAIECTIYGTSYIEGKSAVDESYLKTAFEAIQ